MAKWAKRENGTMSFGVSLSGACYAVLFLMFLSPSLTRAEAMEQSGRTQPIRILALGDSLTHGYGLANGSEFPVQLEQALRASGHDVLVINAGVSGDTSAGGLARLDWSLADNPDVAIVEFGGNDGLRGLSPAEMEGNIDAILARLAEGDVPTLLTGMMAPRNMGPDYAAEFDAVFPRLAERHDVLFYPFFLDGVVLAPDLMQGDGLHPNAQGVAELVVRILPLVVELIAEADSQE